MRKTLIFAVATLAILSGASFANAGLICGPQSSAGCYCKLSQDSADWWSQPTVKPSQTPADNAGIDACMLRCSQYFAQQIQSIPCGHTFDVRACSATTQYGLNQVVRTQGLAGKECLPHCGPGTIQCKLNGPCVHLPLTPSLARSYGCNIRQ